MNLLTKLLIYKGLTKKGGGGPAPTGTIDITENGEYDVSSYAVANVNVSGTSKPYIELQYIESTGTQYIDTGFAPTNYYNKFALDFTMQVIDFNNQTFGVMGTGKYYGGINKDENKVVFSPNGAYSITDITADLTSSHRYRINALTRKYWYDNQSFSFQPALAGTSDKNFTIFGFAPTSLFSARVYSYKIYNDFEEQNFIPILIHDFIPCKRKSDNQVGMWDLVTDTFYANNGTGSFIAGPEVI